LLGYTANPDQAQIFCKSPAKQGFYKKSGLGLFSICCKAQKRVAALRAATLFWALICHAMSSKNYMKPTFTARVVGL